MCVCVCVHTQHILTERQFEWNCDISNCIRGHRDAKIIKEFS